MPRDIQVLPDFFMKTAAKLGSIFRLLFRIKVSCMTLTILILILMYEPLIKVKYFPVSKPQTQFDGLHRYRFFNSDYDADLMNHQEIVQHFDASNAVHWVRGSETCFMNFWGNLQIYTVKLKYSWNHSRLLLPSVIFIGGISTLDIKQ